MEKVVDLSQILANAPRNCWLALNEDQTEVIGRGETIKEAVAEARGKGIEDPIILWSPKALIPAIY